MDSSDKPRSLCRFSRVLDLDERLAGGGCLGLCARLGDEVPAGDKKAEQGEGGTGAEAGEKRRQALERTAVTVWTLNTGF